MAALTTKLGGVMQSLLGGTDPAAFNNTPPLLLLLAAGMCLGGLVFLLLPKQQRGGKDGSKGSSKPLPMPKGHPLIGNTVEVMANQSRFLDWLLDCAKTPELAGADGLGKSSCLCGRERLVRSPIGGAINPSN